MAQLRLQVALAKAGVASRRASEKIIADGRVTVNGQVIREMGVKVDPEADRIAVDGNPLGRPEPPATILLHKPIEVVTTAHDPQGRATVLDLIGGEPYRLVPVGRLDYYTEGLLLLSTDGKLIERLLHPRHDVPKTYMVKVKGRVNDKTLAKLERGVRLEDGPTRPASVARVEMDKDETWLEVVVTEGRNRLVRRMMDAVMHPVRRIVRTEFATLNLSGLKPGQYHYLLPEQTNQLYRAAHAGSAPGAPPRAEETGFNILGRAQRGRGRIPGVD